jgi:hypothetical protein
MDVGGEEGRAPVEMQQNYMLQHEAACAFPRPALSTLGASAQAKLIRESKELLRGVLERVDSTRAHETRTMASLIDFAEGEMIKRHSTGEIQSMRINTLDKNIFRAPHQVTVRCNRPRLEAQYMFKHIEKLLPQVLTQFTTDRGAHVVFNVEHILAIIHESLVLPELQTAVVDLSGDNLASLARGNQLARKGPFRCSAQLGRGRSPAASFNINTPASGKTSMVIAGFLHKVAYPTASYADLCENASLNTAMRRRTPTAPLVEKFANLLLVICKAWLVDHWLREARALCAEAHRSYNMPCAVWNGRPSAMTSIKAAAQRKGAVVWVLASTAHNCKAALTASPTIGFTQLALDEGVMEPVRGDTSPFGQLNVICGTPESINEGKLPAHSPVAMLLNADALYPISQMERYLSSLTGEKCVVASVRQLVMLLMYAPPPWLLDLVARGIEKRLPSELVVHRVFCSRNSLYEAALGTGALANGDGGAGGGVTTISLFDLLSRLSGQVADSCLDAAARDQLHRITSGAATLDVDQLGGMLDTIAAAIDARVHVAEQHRRKQRGDVLRLKSIITELFEGTEPCPICMEDMSAHGEDAAIVMSCCTGRMHRACALQRVPASNGAQVEQMIYAKCPTCRANTSGRAPMQLSTLSAAERLRLELAGKPMDERIEIISSKSFAKPQCVLKLITEAILPELPGARIILAFHFDQRAFGDCKSRYVRVLQGLRSDIPSASVLNAAQLAHSDRGGSSDTRSADEILYDFSNPRAGDATPQILVINSGSDSQTAAGVAADADFMIICDDPSEAIVSQLLGRILRVGHRASASDQSARVIMLKSRAA